MGVPWGIIFGIFILRASECRELKKYSDIFIFGIFILQYGRSAITVPKEAEE